MNIYIYNLSNTYNYGSMMMGENFISYFDALTNKKNKYFVETNDQVNILRLKNATKIDEIFQVKMDSLFKEGTKKYDFVQGYLGSKNVISNFAKKVDLVVVLGGDDFTEDYGWKGPVLNALKFNILQKKGLKVVMLGQTMGPYKSFRKPTMKFLLSKIEKIFPRDPLTFKYLEKMGLRNIEMTDDLALLQLTNQKNLENSQNYIVYCPSELIYRYSKEGTREDWIEFNIFIIEKVLEKFPDKKLVLLAHVLKPTHVDDRIINNELYELIKDKYESRIVLKNEEMYPSEVRNIIQQSYLTISSRMHPIISSIQCGVPGIALSYSEKYWGIIGSRYGLENFIIDVRFLNYQEMKNSFIEKLNIIENEHSEIQNKMISKNKIAKETINGSLRNIAGIAIK